MGKEVVQAMQRQAVGRRAVLHGDYRWIRQADLYVSSRQRPERMARECLADTPFLRVQTREERQGRLEEHIRVCGQTSGQACPFFARSDGYHGTEGNSELPRHNGRTPKRGKDKAVGKEVHHSTWRIADSTRNKQNV